MILSAIGDGDLRKTSVKETLRTWVEYWGWGRGKFGDGGAWMEINLEEIEETSYSQRNQF